MKRVVAVSALFSLFLSGLAFAAERKFEASGEVVTVDPLYSRVTIRHGAIKGFSGDTETEFVVESSKELKGIETRDLVEFKITDRSGDVLISDLKKTGVAPPKDDRLHLGSAVQNVLVSTGEVAKAVTSPIAPAHDVTSAAVAAATDTTGSVLDEADGTVVKNKF